MIPDLKEDRVWQAAYDKKYNKKFDKKYHKLMNKGICPQDASSIATEHAELAARDYADAKLDENRNAAEALIGNCEITDRTSKKHGL